MAYQLSGRGTIPGNQAMMIGTQIHAYNDDVTAEYGMNDAHDFADVFCIQPRSVVH